MKIRLSVVMVLVLTTIALAADSSLVVADKYVKLLVAKNYDEAAKMLKPGGGNTPQNLKMLAGLKLNPTAGATKIEIGAVIFSKDTERQSIVIYERKITIAPDKVAQHKKQFAESFTDDFPPEQIPAAKKTLRWTGNVWMDILPVYLEREITYKDVVVNGVVTEKVKVYGPWLVNMKGENFPLKEFRPDVMKKFGANILRWGGEDLGDAGCVDPKDPTGYCHEGESPNLGGDAKCYYKESGEPCPEYVSCFSLKEFDPSPCKRGQRGCMTGDGEECYVK